MVKHWKVLWLCALMSVSLTYGRSVVPRKAGEKPDPRDLWGLVNMWEGDDLGNLPSGLCSHLSGQEPNVLIPNQFGGYPGSGNSGGGHVPLPLTPATAYIPPSSFPGGYTSGIHHSNVYGGFPGVPVSVPGGFYQSYLPPTPGHGYTAGGHTSNVYGGFNGVPVSVPVVSTPSNPTYGTPVNAPVGSTPSDVPKHGQQVFIQSPSYIAPSSFPGGYTEGMHHSNIYGGFQGVPGTGLTGTSFVDPALRPGLGQTGYVVAGAGGSYNNAQSNSEHTAFEQSKEHASHSSGAQGNNYYGANVGVGVGPYPSSQFVAAQGNQFASSNSDKESSMSQSQKESNSASSGSTGQYYGAAGYAGGRPGYPVGASQVVAVDGSQFANSQSNKESSMSQSQKESNSASSGSAGQYYGAAVSDCGGRPCPVRPYGASQVVAVDGSQFSNSQSNKESSMAESQKESNSASSGSTGQYYGAAGYGGRPSYIGGASQVVAADGSQFANSQSNKESIKAEHNKESNSASSGAIGQYYGAGIDSGCGGRPCQFGASQVVAVDGSQFSNSANSKESSKAESQKESNSASSGSTGQYYGAAGYGGGRPGYPVGASQVVAVDGSQFANSQSNKESTKAEHNKESSSASSGATGQYYGAEIDAGCGGRPCPIRPFGASQVVAVDGSQFANSASSKESSKAESQKESNSASSGSTGQFYGAAGYSGQPGYPVGASQVVAGQGAQFQTSDSNSESTKQEHSKESNSASSGATGQYYGESGVGVGLVDRRPYNGASQIVAADSAQFQNSDSSKESSKFEQNKASNSASSGQQGGYYGASVSNAPYGVGSSQVVAAGQGSQFQTSSSDSESTKQENSKESASSSSGSQGQFAAATNVGYVPNRGQVVSVEAGQGAQFQNSESSAESSKLEHAAEHSSASSGSSQSQLDANIYGLNRPGVGVGVGNQFVAGTGTAFQNSSHDKELTKFDAEKSHSSSSSGSAASNAAVLSVGRREASSLVAAGSERSPNGVRPRSGDLIRFDCSGCKVPY